MTDRIYSMLGLCMKAGMLSYGSDMCEEKIQFKKVYMIIVAENASNNTKEKFKSLCEGKVQYVQYGSVDEISHSIGKDNKAVVGIMDEGFCRRINELLEEKLKGANI